MNGGPQPINEGLGRESSPGSGTSRKLSGATLWLRRFSFLERGKVHAGRFMARDYVNVREEQRNGQTLWTFATVSLERLKSAPAKVTRRGSRYAIMGAAWGAPIAAVEVRIDNGPWAAAKLVDSPSHTGDAHPCLAFLDVRVGDASLRRAPNYVAGVRCRRQHPASAGRPLPRQQEDVLGGQRANNPSGPHSLTARDRGGDTQLR